MANLLKRWVESDKRELKRLGKIADKVESYADEFGALSAIFHRRLSSRLSLYTQRLRRFAICQFLPILNKIKLFPNL